MGSSVKDGLRWGQRLKGETWPHYHGGPGARGGVAAVGMERRGWTQKSAQRNR